MPALFIWFSWGYSNYMDVQGFTWIYESDYISYSLLMVTSLSSMYHAHRGSNQLSLEKRVPWTADLRSMISATLAGCLLWTYLGYHGFTKICMDLSGFTEINGTYEDLGGFATLGHFKLPDSLLIHKFTWISWIFRDWLDLRGFTGFSRICENLSQDLQTFWKTFCLGLQTYLFDATILNICTWQSLASTRLKLLDWSVLAVNQQCCWDVE